MNSEEIEDSRTRGEKARDSIYKKFGEGFYADMGRVSGKKSKNRPFRDPEAARRAVNARWDRYRQQKREK